MINQLKTPQDYMDAGYYITSRKYGIVSRIDRTDWVEYMAKQASRNLEDGLDWVYVLGLDSAADHYRRVYSKDKKTITDGNILRGITNSRDARL